jgi:hypothetical protein
MFLPGLDGKVQEREREDASPKYLEWDLCAVHNAGLRAPVASLSYARRSWWEGEPRILGERDFCRDRRCLLAGRGGLLLKRTR